MSETRTPSEDAYAPATGAAKAVAAPALDYQPPRARSYAPRIALIGAGGISFAHLDAYRKARLDVRVISSEPKPGRAVFVTHGEIRPSAGDAADGGAHRRKPAARERAVAV